MTNDDNARINNGAGFFFARLDERTSVMDGEQNGTQTQQGTQQQEQQASQQQTHQQETQAGNANLCSPVPALLRLNDLARLRQR